MNMSQYQRQFIYSCEKCGKRYQLLQPPSKTGFKCGLCGGKMLPPTKEYIMNGIAKNATTTEEVEE